MKKFVFSGLLVAGLMVMGSAMAAAPSLEQCANGLFAKHHATFCAGVASAPTIGQNGGDLASPGHARP